MLWKRYSQSWTLANPLCGNLCFAHLLAVWKFPPLSTPTENKKVCFGGRWSDYIIGPISRCRPGTREAMGLGLCGPDAGQVLERTKEVPSLSA